jgi:virginiamycin B lyase
VAPNLNRLRPHRLIGVAFAIALIGASTPMATAAPPPKPPPSPAVVWSPSTLDLTVTRGTSTTARADFTAAKKLASGTVSDTGGTASFVTESPTSFKSAPASTPISVTLTVTVPGGAALGDYTGSVVVSSGRKALANSLPLTVHVVAPTGHIYWTNASVGIGRADLDGSNPDEAFITAVDAGQPVGVAVDAQYVYWTDVNNHRIGRANLDGTNPDPTFLPLTYLDPGDLSTQPIGIAVDGQYIYWSDADYPSIGRANLDGSNVLPGFIDLSDVTCGPGSPSSCALPTGIAVDGQHVYWTDEGWQGGSVGRADLDGANANKSFLIIGGNTEWGIAVDAQHVYWTWSIYPADGYVGRANLDGSSANSTFISTSAYATLGLAVDSAHIYWSNNFGVNGEIGRSALDGSNQEPSFLPLSGAPPFLAVGN